MLESLIALSVVTAGLLIAALKIRTALIEAQESIIDVDGFCRRQVDINNLLVEELVKLKSEVQSWDEVTKEVDVTDLVASMDSSPDEEGPCPGHGRHKNTKFGSTKEMNVIDHKWS
tara:strand:+ start:54 stop:401 length:348 start_codon:yes stop_codon:yes gene_type:complete